MLIQCLSLHQPWASLIAAGEKRIETRSWKYVGKLPTLLAIHAARTFCLPGAIDPDALPAFRAALGNCSWARLPAGAVVAVVRLVECVSTTLALAGPLGCLAGSYLHQRPREKHFGDYRPGRYAWTWDRIYPLDPPVPARGRQLLWKVDLPGVEDAVADWLPALTGREE